MCRFIFTSKKLHFIDKAAIQGYNYIIEWK